MVSTFTTFFSFIDKVKYIYYNTFKEESHYD